MKYESPVTHSPFISCEQGDLDRQDKNDMAPKSDRGGGREWG